MIDPDTLRQRLAVSGLIGNCEGLLKSAELNPSQRASLQLMLDNVLDAYGMQKTPPFDHVAARNDHRRDLMKHVQAAE